MRVDLLASVIAVCRICLENIFLLSSLFLSGRIKECSAIVFLFVQKAKRASLPSCNLRSFIVVLFLSPSLPFVETPPWQANGVYVASFRGDTLIPRGILYFYISSSRSAVHTTTIFSILLLNFLVLVAVSLISHYACTRNKRPNASSYKGGANSTGEIEREVGRHMLQGCKVELSFGCEKHTQVTKPSYVCITRPQTCRLFACRPTSQDLQNILQRTGRGDNRKPEKHGVSELSLGCSQANPI